LNQNIAVTKDAIDCLDVTIADAGSDPDLKRDLQRTRSMLQVKLCGMILQRLLDEQRQSSPQLRERLSQSIEMLRQHIERPSSLPLPQAARLSAPPLPIFGAPAMRSSAPEPVFQFPAAAATLAPFQAAAGGSSAGQDVPASSRSIVHGGYEYKSLADHDPHSTARINECGKLFSMDNAWHVSPSTADALHVCKTYPWGTFCLVFADGSAYETFSGGSWASPGDQIRENGSLRETDGKYGAAVPGILPSVRTGNLGTGIPADVLIRRKM
jgi:hypothetical protein